MHNSPKRCLFVAYGGGHMRMLVPIIQALPEYIKPQVLALTTAVFPLEEAGISYKTYEDLLPLGNAHAKQWGEALTENFPTGTLPRSHSIAYMGLNYAELVDTYGEQAAQARYTANARQAFYPIHLMQRVLEAWQPDCVVATNSPRSEKAILKAANLLDIPSICCVDLLAKHEAKWIARPGFADKICVLNQAVADFFITQGADAQQMVVTGNPAFDGLKQYLQISQGRFSPNKTWLWASQPEPERHPFTHEPTAHPDLPLAIEAELIRIAKANPQWHFVFRQHPSESRRYPLLPSNISISPKDIPLPAQITMLDGVITTTSTVGLESVLLKKDLITIEMSVFTPDMPYAQLGLARGIKNLAVLESALGAEALALSDACLPPCGQATQAVIEVIEAALVQERVV